MQTRCVVQRAHHHADEILPIDRLIEQRRAARSTESVFGVAEVVPPKRIGRVRDVQGLELRPCGGHEVPGQPAAILTVALQDLTERSAGQVSHGTAEASASATDRVITHDGERSQPIYPLSSTLATEPSEGGERR